MEENYFITFTYKGESKKSITVWKKTKLINKVFFIPKSIIISSSTYLQEKQHGYTRERITIELPEWYCKKELGFYI